MNRWMLLLLPILLIIGAGIGAWWVAVDGTRRDRQRELARRRTGGAS